MRDRHGERTALKQPSQAARTVGVAPGVSAEPPRRRFRPPLTVLWRLFGMQVCGVVLIVVGTIVRAHLAVVIMASFLVLVSLLRAWWEPSRTTRWMAWISPVLLAASVVVWLVAG